MTGIRAFGDPVRRTNAELMMDCIELGYVRPQLDGDDVGPILDATYGEGGMWKDVDPPHALIKNDLDPDRGDVHFDYREPPAKWAGLFSTIVFDPPYKLQGSHSTGNAELSQRFGLSNYQSVADIHSDMRLGVLQLYSCLREHGFMLVKCQDQVAGGQMRWQTHLVASWAGEVGLHVVDQLMVAGYRPQPKGRVQRTAHRDYSSLMVLRKGTDRRRFATPENREEDHEE